MRKLTLITFSRELLSIAQMEVVFWTFHVQKLRQHTRVGSTYPEC
jgi:hypothetical protein